MASTSDNTLILQFAETRHKITQYTLSMNIEYSQVKTFFMIVILPNTPQINSSIGSSDIKQIKSYG